MRDKQEGQIQAQRYFVVHLDSNHAQYEEGVRMFQIQVLDNEGLAMFMGYIGEKEQELAIQGHHVPYAVLAAARRQSRGQGDYVNDKGESISPF